MLAACAPGRSWGSGAPRRRGRRTGAAVVPGGRAVRRGCLSRLGRCCFSLSLALLPTTRCPAPHALLGRMRVHGSRAAPAAAGDGCEESCLNPSVSLISINLAQEIWPALTDGTSHPPPRRRSRKVQDSIELVSDPQLRRNRLVRHSSTVCGGEPQNFTQSDRRHARPRKVTHMRDAIDAALPPVPQFPT